MSDTISALVLKICDISPSAKQYIDSTSYLVHIDEDEIKVPDFINLMVQQVVSDAFELGIRSI